MFFRERWRSAGDKMRFPSDFDLRLDVDALNSTVLLELPVTNEEHHTRKPLSNDIPRRLPQQHSRSISLNLHKPQALSPLDPTRPFVIISAARTGGLFAIPEIIPCTQVYA